VKDSIGNETIMLTGDGGHIELDGTLSVNTINDKIDGSGVTVEQVLLKNNNVTAHTIRAENYAVGDTNFISATRQGNFRDVGVKDSIGNETIMLTGDGGHIELDGTLSVNTINEKTSGSGVTFLSDVSINTHLTVPDASINRIAPIDGSLIIIGDLSVNGSVVSNDGELGFAGTWKITANGSSSYRFTGNGLNGTQDNPTLFLIRGSKYKFNNISGGHVIGLRDSNNTVYTDGFNGTIFEVPQDAPDELEYYCTTVGHNSMKGTLKIIGRGTQDSSFNIIEEFTPGSGITFLSDVSINTHLTVPDASINRIAPIDGSLIIMGDLSVNGKIFSSDGLVGGGSGTTQNIQLLKVFDNLSATTDQDPNGTTPWISQNTLSFDASSILFHNIKTSGYVTPGGGFTWPLGGHQWILRRGDNSNNLSWDGDTSSNILRHTFNRQGDHEHENFSFIEEITSDVSYSHWQCDFSGGGARNNNQDKITWTITNISSSTSFNNVGGSGSNSENASFDNISSYTSNSTTTFLNDVSVNGDISAELFCFNNNNSPSFSGHLIPTVDNMFDIGSATNKIRDLYVSDSTIWVGDENKLSIKDGNFKFRKLKRESGVLPYKLGHSGIDLAIQSVESSQGNWTGKNLKDMKLSDWDNFINKSDENIKLKIKDAGINNVGDIFIDDRDEDLKDDTLINDISSSGVSKFTDIEVSNKIMMPNLPTSDPFLNGQLWNDNGLLKISSG